MSSFKKGCEEAPLVSVLMPAFNAANTIEFALASLFAQSYANWECVIVDDGSTDETRKLLSEVVDPRVKVICFPENQGRGMARRASLEAAVGKYITMLDADDWLYPDKIEKQVAFLERHEDVVLHSMGMAISDGDEIVSVRRVDATVDRNLDTLHRIFIPHAPSMIRRSAIGGVSYDSRFKLAQDQDFLRRVLIGKRYVVVSDIGYCYSEVQSVGVGKVLRGYFYNGMGYLKLVKYFGLASFIFALAEFAKPLVVLGRYLKGGRRYVLAKRSVSPGVADRNDFERAKAYISDVHSRVMKART